MRERWGGGRWRGGGGGNEEVKEEAQGYFSFLPIGI